MFITVHLKKILTIFAVIVALILLISVLSLYINKLNALSALKQANSNVLVIDPGHGGRDGGAISAAGAKESDINLAICLKMCAIADFVGVNHIETRTEDTDGYTDGDYSERDNLLRRVEIANSAENAVLVSVHQNKYPSELIRGAEVMYAKTQGSEELGLSAQDNLVRFLDKENRRVARPAPEELLLTSSVNCPAILVECGFMSNPDEADSLSTSGYQLKIAAILISTYMNYCRGQAA